jgi:tetratricopeptide (TPR) repeat protein
MSRMRYAPAEAATGVPLRICLSMIARNEQAIIERCLNAAVSIADAVVICDTGSTDETPRIAARWLAARGVPGRVVHHPWQDFGANRTAAVREAETFVSRLGWPLDRTYWLFLDADHELVVEPGFDRETMTAGAIALRQSGGALSYWNVRLGRASDGWRAVGRTHEYYTSVDAGQPARLDTLWIRDRGDGGCRADKFVRDIALLTAQLAETPDDPRTLFYLAQSYLSVGQPLKALTFFRRRIAAGGWAEEVWYAKLCVGRILAESTATDAALAVLDAAHREDERRAEPLYELARLHRRLGRMDEAIACAERGRAVPAPAHSALFVHTDVQAYGLDLEIARAAAGTAHAERGLAACERLARSRTVPAAVAEEARHLEAGYVAPLAGLSLTALTPKLPAPYRPCNPSIRRTTDGYLVICRAVNYEQSRLRYRTLDADGIYRTRNVLMRLDRSGIVVDERPLTIDEPPLRADRVQGLEDCRLVAGDDRLRFTCTTTDRHPRQRVHESLCDADATGRVRAHRPLVGAFDDRPQKNWLPFVDNKGRLLAIYGYEPLTIVRISEETGAYAVELATPSPVRAAAWRGSAGPLPWAGRGGTGWLVLVHEVVHRMTDVDADGADPIWERIYFHRFVEYDAGFRLRRLSRPFVFTHLGVEFAGGMTFAHDEDSLVISFGIEDCEAHLGRIARADVDARLEPVGASR